MMGQLDVFAADIAAATGFTIYGVARNGPINGLFTVAWVWV
jgi:hypothetical protein